MKIQCDPLILTEEDILKAMEALQGYVDITPGTFKEIYALSYDLALKRIRSLGKAEEIMTTPVHCLNREMSLTEAASFMSEYGISGAPVVDGKGRICGVISEKDFLHKMGLPTSAGIMSVVGECLAVNKCLVSSLRYVFVHELMSQPPIVVHKEASLTELSKIFTDRSVNRIPICNVEGVPLGIVTRSDLVSSICQMV
ncbi:CBS domain-containing protein [Halodesulfovibrio aestuarii]|uniref:CBS domain-containing protein n=1 Tax=Halodesulfovibrio aestuarii TaxID=126333 RepID=A0ABV4JZV6_9BACT